MRSIKLFNIHKIIYHKVQSKQATIFIPFVFFVFTIVATTTGIIIVCLTSAKRDDICKYTFKRLNQPNIEYDSHPNHISVGYLNKDRYLDIVIANSGTDSIGIFFGYGNKTFTSQTSISTGFQSHPCCVSIGDFNNDNNSDIAVANYGINSIAVFLGYGNGSFVNQRITSLDSSRPQALATGDLNSDNQLDVVTASYSTEIIIIFYGSNDGGFNDRQTYPMGYDSNPYSLTIADLNKDNKLDIIVVNYNTNELVVLLADRTQTFIMYKYLTGKDSHPCSVAIGNFDDDEQLDIVVANSGTKTVGIFFGYGNGTFQIIKLFPTGFQSRPSYLVTGYFSKHTKHDIIVADSGENQIIIFETIENGNISIRGRHSTGFSSNPHSMAVGDFDNDCKLDIGIINNETNSILILTNYGVYPKFTEAIYESKSESSLQAVAAGDFNNDTMIDIVVAYYYSDSIGILINLGNKTFQSEEIYYMDKNSGPYYVVTDDINNDNNTDIVVLLKLFGCINILFGYGNGKFRRGDLYSIGDQYVTYTINIVDLNSDGNLDVITSNYSPGNIGIFFGYGDGTFTNVTYLFVSDHFSPKCIAVGDFNNDHIPDIALHSKKDSAIVVLLQDRHGIFYEGDTIETKDDLPYCFTVGDLNKDNRLDIVYSDDLSNGIGVLLGNGNGTFTNLTKYAAACNTSLTYITMGYLNYDEFLDVAVSNTDESNINVFFGNGNGTFGQPIRISTGLFSEPWSVLFADINNDKQNDIVIGNNFVDNILILFVNNDADFVNETIRSTGSASHPYSIDIGDFNRDGKPDIVIANSGTNDIEILMNYNTTNFVNRTRLWTGFSSHPQDILIADVNADYIDDIVVANSWSNQISIFIAMSAGNFEAKPTYSLQTESYPSSIAVGDFDNDNRTDIVTTNQNSNSLSLFLAFDYAKFDNHFVYESIYSYGSASVITADFNNDHCMDIFLANKNIRSFILQLGNGDGTFMPLTRYRLTDSSFPISFAIGDFNNDSLLDVVGVHSDDKISLYMGKRDATFKNLETYSTGIGSAPNVIATGDLNNDRILDIVVVHSKNGHVGMFLGDGDGTFQKQVTYTNIWKYYANWIALADFNGDGNLDIIVANVTSSNISVLFGYGNGTIDKYTNIPIVSQPRSSLITLVDFNEDKIMDIAFVNKIPRNLIICYGSENGSFSSQTIYSFNFSNQLTSLYIYDVNNDGVLDIVVSYYAYFDSGLAIIYGLPNGKFTKPSLHGIDSDYYPSIVALIDYNNDNRIDLLVTDLNTDRTNAMIQKQLAPFSSQNIINLGNDSQPSSLVIADFNNDYQLDIAVAASGLNCVMVMIGRGDGEFSGQVHFSTGLKSFPTAIISRDLNQDYNLDIVTANSGTNNILVLFGSGNGTFQVGGNYSTGLTSYPSSIAIADLNNDHYLDIVVSNKYIGNFLLFYGLGNGIFSYPTLYSTSYQTYPQSVSIADINNDNLLDIVICNYGTDGIDIFFQTC